MKVTKTELRKVITKLDDVQVELLRPAGPAPTGGATNNRREATDCPRPPTDS